MATNVIPQQAVPLQSLRGVNGQIDVYADRVVIRRYDLLSQLFCPEQSFRYDQITGVRLYESRFMEKGWIELVIIGHSDRCVRLVYRCDQHRQAVAVQQLIESRLG